MYGLTVTDLRNLKFGTQKVCHLTLFLLSNVKNITAERFLVKGNSDKYIFSLMVARSLKIHKTELDPLRVVI
jgi:hypothetical protein